MTSYACQKSCREYNQQNRSMCKVERQAREERKTETEEERNQIKGIMVWRGKARKESETTKFCRTKKLNVEAKKKVVLF